MEVLFVGLGTVAFVALAIGATMWHYGRATSLLDGWTRAQGFDLISADRRLLARGPFWWRSGEGNVVYRVRVRDRSGCVRSGYVRCGSLLGGMLSDQVTVEWDD